MNPVYAQEIYDVQPGLNSANTCLWKPASTSVLSNYASYQILQESGMPPGVISFLPSAGKVAGEAINHPSFAGLHSTGSTNTFNTLWRQVGDNLDNYTGYPRMVGETGGKNFHLMHPSADVDHTVMNTIRGAFEYQGQKCSATSRFYVPKSKWGIVKEKMLAAHAEIKVGNVDDFSVYVTAVIDGTAFKDHKNYIDHAHAAPECEIIAGGKYDDSVGWFIDPTIIVTSDPNTKTMQEEIFGPILTVFVYDDSKPDWWRDVMQVVDTTTPYGLTGSIFANDRTALESGSDGLRHSSGMLYLNDKSTGAVVGEQPFGGSRKSGTNDKAGSHLNLLRWCSARTIKETTSYISDFKYPYMKPE